MANALELIEKEKREKTGYLDLGCCGLTDWPDLTGLDWLHTLILSNTWWDVEYIRWIDSRNEGFPNFINNSPIKPLPLNIKRAMIGGNPFDGIWGIKEISFLENLHKLKFLYIGSNRISDISPLAKLTNLNSLDIGSNQITEFNSLEHLKNLTSLGVGYSQIHDASFLGKLKNLTSLGISNNEINDFSFLENLKNLTYLGISNNNVENLTPFLHLIKNGIPIVWNRGKSKSINVEGNPLIYPPIEIAKQGNTAILEYFRQKQFSGIDLLLEAKLILLGDGRSGKTSLANRLLGKELPKEEDRTQGVKIVIGEYGFDVAGGKKFKLNIWDFAGQDKYKPLHQFFYTESSVYVMVAPSGSGTTDFDDWLQTAELFGEGSPLVILLNEFKDGMGLGSFDAEAWKRRFPNLLKEVYCLNLKEAKDLGDLPKHLHLLAESLPHTKYEFPANWAAIRRELENRREENYISLPEYLHICAANHLPEEKSALILSSVLHKVGTCLHYQGNQLLEQHVILKNEWATMAVYKILEDKAVAEDNKGFFTKADLERIWSEKEYRHMRPQLLELMCQFRMAYPLPNDKGYITPPLLPTAPPHHWQWKEGHDIELRLEYEFMPKALMTQFIVSRYLDIDENRTLVWRNGVALRWDEAVAKVEKTKSQGLDAFVIQCHGREKKALMTSILKTFRDLHEEYKGIKVTENVPCNCDGCRSEANKQHFFKFETLRKWTEKGIPDIRCEQSADMVNILELLGEVLLMKKTGEGRGLDIDPKTQNRFTSKMIQDLVGKDQLEDALKALDNALPDETEMIINLKRRLTETKNNQAMQTIDSQDGDRELNRIANAIVELAKKIS